MKNILECLFKLKWRRETMVRQETPESPLQPGRLLIAEVFLLLPEFGITYKLKNQKSIPISIDYLFQIVVLAAKCWWQSFKLCSKNIIIKKWIIEKIRLFILQCKNGSASSVIKPKIKHHFGLRRDYGEPQPTTLGTQEETCYIRIPSRPSKSQHTNDNRRQTCHRIRSKFKLKI
jgi:hypothetical protein